MNWSKAKEKFLNHFNKSTSYLTYNSHLRIPIVVNTIHVTQASTQTHSISRRKYRNRFQKCLVELTNKYPRLPAHDEIEPTNQSIWFKLLESREDLFRLNQTLEDLDQRLENLSLKTR